MSASRIRTRTALAVLLFASLAEACGRPSPPLPPASQSLPGRRHYEALKCFGCHGTDLGGTDKGPSLRTAARTWETEALVRFLAHPDSARASDPRLMQLSRAYAPIAMPGYDLPPQPLRELADYLIAATR